MFESVTQEEISKTKAETVKQNKVIPQQKTKEIQNNANNTIVKIPQLEPDKTEIIQNNIVPQKEQIISTKSGMQKKVIDTKNVAKKENIQKEIVYNKTQETEKKNTIAKNINITQGIENKLDTKESEKTDIYEWLLNKKEIEKMEQIPKVIMPSSISKKQYENSDNEYLATAVYMDDFKKLFLININNQNISNLNGLLAIVKHTNFIEKESQETPLTFAIKMNKTNVARYLISRGASVNMQNGFKESPKDIARHIGNQDIISLLDLLS